MRSRRVIRAISGLIVAVLVLLGIGLAQSAQAVPKTSGGDLRGPVAQFCENWNSFNQGDFYTAPVAGQFKARQIGSVASDGTITLQVSLKADGLTPSGPIDILQHTLIISHGFGSCSPDVSVATALIDRHGRLRDASFTTTFTRDDTSTPGGFPAIESPEWAICFGAGSTNCLRTGPLDISS